MGKPTCASTPFPETPPPGPRLLPAAWESRLTGSAPLGRPTLGGRGTGQRRGRREVLQASSV